MTAEDWRRLPAEFSPGVGTLLQTRKTPHCMTAAVRWRGHHGVMGLAGAAAEVGVELGRPKFWRCEAPRRVFVAGSLALAYPAGAGLIASVSIRSRAGCRRFSRYGGTISVLARMLGILRWSRFRVRHRKVKPAFQPPTTVGLVKPLAHPDAANRVRSGTAARVRRRVGVLVTGSHSFYSHLDFV